MARLCRVRQAVREPEAERPQRGMFVHPPDKLDLAAGQLAACVKLRSEAIAAKTAGSPS